MFRIIGRILLPLTADQLSETLLDEVKIGISDGPSLIHKIERREIFNSIYDIELQQIYENEEMIRELIQKLRINSEI